MNDGSRERTNQWTADDWARKTNDQRYGVEWLSGESPCVAKANWTRFMNTARGPFLNVNMVTSGTLRAKKYKAYAFVSCRVIYPGDELF